MFKRSLKNYSLTRISTNQMPNPHEFIRGNSIKIRENSCKKDFFNALNKKGVVLLIVLGMLLVVVSLVTVMLSLILSRARLTHHQTSRIQAYYASMAGINYGLEQLRTRTWIAGTNCTVGSPCTMSFAYGDFKPASIVGNSVSITIKLAGSSGCLSPPAPSGGACVSATADYSYTSP